MAKVLYTWELGGGLGHVARALPLTRAFRSQGHDVVAALKAPSAAAVVFPEGELEVRQAPACAPARRVIGYRPISYAEILLQCGLGDAAKLGDLVKRWTDLFAEVRPDLVMLDYSPAAMLAARVAGIRHCTVGHGFFLPPKLTPVPAFLEPADPERLLRGETVLLDAINDVLVRFGGAPLACFADFFDADVDLLTTWPEVEHYPQRRGATYWGPVLMRDEGLPPDWPTLPGPKFFVYIQGQDTRTEPLLRAIEAVQGVALVYAPGLSADALKRFKPSQRLRFSRAPYTAGEAARQADAVICHAGFGTVWEALLAGTLLLCLPLHQEQQMVARQLERLGVAVAVSGRPAEANLSDALNRLLSEPGYRRNAERIADKYRSHDAKSQLARIVDASLGDNGDGE